jgi:hypothetical protein
MAIQSWVNREYRSGLSTPLWAPVLRVSVGEVLLPTFTIWGWEFRIQLHREGFIPEALSLVTSLEDTRVLKAEL